MTGKRLIDANALHAKILEENKRNYSATENVAQILLRIETAPTIEAEPVRHGRWEKHKDFLCYCTICGAVISLPHHKFCGNCGAKMEWGAENEMG